MATLSFTIPDEHLAGVVEAFAVKFGYQAQIQDPAVTDGISTIPNPQTKAAFAKEKMVQHIRFIYIKYKADVDAEAAIQTAKDAATADADTFIEA